MVLPSIKKKVDSCVSRKFESSKRSCELDSLKVHKHTVVFKLFYRSLTNVTDVYIQSFIDRHKALIWIKKFGDRSLIYKIRMWIDGEKVGEKYTTNCPMCTILLMGTGQVSWKYSDSEWISIQEYNSRNKKINICRPSIPKSLTNPLKLDEKIMNGNLNKPSLASKAFRMMSILECKPNKNHLLNERLNRLLPLYAPHYLFHLNLLFHGKTTELCLSIQQQLKKRILFHLN